MSKDRSMAVRNQFDGAWKKAIHQYFQPFLALFFPDIDTDVDWSHSPEFLDRELEKIARSAKLGRRHVDLLVRLHRRNGEVGCVLLHVEVQGQPDADFARRMWVYHCRVHDLHGGDIASLALLADSDGTWRPHAFTKELWGCHLEFGFRTVKLLDYRARLTELEQGRNPFGLLVAAYLHAQATRPISPERFVSKLRLVRGLYDRGLTREELVDLFACLDWFLVLSPSLDKKFCDEMTRFEEEKSVPHITSVERVGFGRGRREGHKDGHRDGLSESLLAFLEGRFGQVPESLRSRLHAIEDTKLLLRLARAAAVDDSLDTFTGRLPT